MHETSLARRCPIWPSSLFSHWYSISYSGTTPETWNNQIIKMRFKMLGVEKVKEASLIAVYIRRKITLYLVHIYTRTHTYYETFLQLQAELKSKRLVRCPEKYRETISSFFFSKIQTWIELKKKSQKEKFYAIKIIIQAVLKTVKRYEVQCRFTRIYRKRIHL